jgi:hypothetical protein
VRRIHVAQSVARAIGGRIYRFANLPRIRTFTLDRTFDHGAEYVGHRFIERARFIRISQVGCSFRHAMRHFMAADIQRNKRRKRRSVSVAVRHLLPIPKGIVVTRAVSHDAGNQAKIGIFRGRVIPRSTSSIDSVTAMHVREIIVGLRRCEMRIRGCRCRPRIVRIGQTRRCRRRIAVRERSNLFGDVFEVKRAVETRRSKRDRTAVQRRCSSRRCRGLQIIVTPNLLPRVRIDEKYRHRRLGRSVDSSQLHPINQMILAFMAQHLFVDDRPIRQTRHAIVFAQKILQCPRFFNRRLDRQILLHPRNQTIRRIDGLTRLIQMNDDLSPKYFDVFPNLLELGMRHSQLVNPNRPRLQLFQTPETKTLEVPGDMFETQFRRQSDFRRGITVRRKHFRTRRPLSTRKFFARYDICPGNSLVLQGQIRAFRSPSATSSNNQH